MRNQDEIRAAAKALTEVGKNARIYLSMPLIEGVTPRALVTGAAGFIGSNVTRNLLGRGWDVRGVFVAPEPHGRRTFAPVGSRLGLIR